MVTDNIIAIHGVPRSGTSWLGQLFNSNPHVAYRYQPFFSYAFRDRIDMHSNIAALREFFRDLLESDDAFLLQTGVARLSAATPRFEKLGISHLVYKEVRFHHLLPHLLATVPGLKGIGIVRDPRAVLASWIRAPREFDPTWSLADEWRHAKRKNAGLEENWYGYERWKQLAGCFMHLETQYSERFRLIRYEDLARNPAGTMRALFDFCGLAYERQSRRFVVESTSRDDGDSYGVFRRHGVGKHATLLNIEIRDWITRDLLGTPLSRFLSE